LPATRFVWVAAVIGLFLLATGIGLISNAYTGGGAGVTDYLNFGRGRNSQNSTLFMKPSDRLIISAGSNVRANISVQISRVVTGQVVAREMGNGTLYMQFAPETRGVYLLSVSALAPLDERGANTTATGLITIEGGPPNDLLELGYVLTALSLPLLGLWAVGSRRKVATPRSGNLKPGGGTRSSRAKRFGALLRLELVASGRLYFVFPIVLMSTLSAGGYFPSLKGVNHTSNLFFLTNNATSDWNILFPLVVALTTFSFAYEKDKLALRSLFLAPVRSVSVFASKVLVIFLVVVVPLVASFLLLFALFDPALFLSSPFVVLANAWNWIGAYTILAFVMVSFGLLPACLFKRPLLSLVVPLFVSFVLQGQGFGIGLLLPWYVWGLYADFALYASNFDWYQFLGHATPSIIAAAACFIVAFALFEWEEKE
jgi:hypothetical protein